MKLTVLGSGNAFSQSGRLNSSYLVGDKQEVLVDCGFTTPLALQRAEVPFNQIKTIFITHYHGDHFAGLAAFLLGLKYVSPQKQVLTIIGAADAKKKCFDLLKALYPGNETLVDELQINFIGSEKGLKKDVELVTCSFNTFKMIHSEKSLPFGFVLKFDESKIGFTGDTCWHSGVEELIAASDIAVVECNFNQKVGEGHISVDELEENEVVQTNKKHIYLTHLSPLSSERAVSLDYNLLSDFDVLSF